MKLFSFRQRLAGALGIAALAVAACGSSSGGGGSSPTPAEETADPNAVNGGTMTVGLVQEPTSFLAAGIVDSMTFSYAADAPIAEGLLWYRSVDETQSAKSLADFWRPDLATEVPTTANGDVKTSGCKDASAKMCVTWKLRSGVKWQDGSAFTSHDVCATIQFFWLKYKDKNPTAILSTTGWDKMIGCSEDSTNQATVSFSQQLGSYLAFGTGVYGILPAKLLENAFNANGGAGGDLEKTPQTVDLTYANPAAFKGTDTLDKIIMGTGPYVLQAYEPTKDIILVKNQHYWDKVHQPHLDKIVFKIISDVKAQLDAARSGELDFGLDYRLSFLKDLQDASSASGKFKVETIPESGAEKIDLNLCDNSAGKCGSTAVKSPYTADPKFRKALIEALNRQQYVNTIAAGQTVVPADSWIYLGSEYIKDSNVPTTAYNAQKAASDLDAAGYKVSSSCHAGSNPGRADPSGKCVVLDFVTTAGNPARAQAQIAVQQDLRAVGIETNLSTVKAGALFGGFSDGGLLYTHKFQMAMYTNTLSAPAEPDGWYAGYHSSQIPSAANSGQGQNDTGENNPTVDKAFEDARNSVDLAVRTKAYKQAEEALAQDLPEIPLYQQVTVNSYTTKLHDLKRNDLVWTFNMYDWWCTAGNCQA